MEECSNFFYINFDKISSLIDDSINSNNQKTQAQIIKELQDQILVNLNKKFNKNFTLICEIKFVMWIPNDIEQKII